MILLVQDPFGDTRIEQLLLRHIAKLPRIDGICYPEAVHPADVIAGDNCSRPAEPKHLRAIDNLGLPNTFEQNLQPRRHDRKHVHYPSPAFLTRTGPCACSRATGTPLVLCGAILPRYRLKYRRSGGAWFFLAGISRPSASLYSLHGVAIHSYRAVRRPRGPRTGGTANN